jgi:glutamate-1-semialdehyde aminotransferase
MERQVAEKLVDLVGSRVPGWPLERLGVRFGLSGTDATTMAIRLARAVTERSQVYSSGYHGWMDWSISKTPPAWGIEEFHDVHDFPFNMIPNITERTACVIVEQAMVDPIPEGGPIGSHTLGFYGDLRERCNRAGALLIMDEVVTGFRWALGGAAEYYGIEPDIVCYGKALGNGVPLSAIVGRREYFEWFSRNDPVFVSSTHFGNALSLAAADAVLDIWNEEGVAHLWNIGDALIAGLGLAGYKVIGHGPRSLLQFDSQEERAFFIVGMRDRGILVNRPNLPNLAHSMEDVRLTVQAAKEVKEAMASVNVYAEMEGKLPRVLFERR